MEGGNNIFPDEASAARLLSDPLVDGDGGVALLVGVEMLGELVCRAFWFTFPEKDSLSFGSSRISSISVLSSATTTESTTLFAGERRSAGVTSCLVETVSLDFDEPLSEASFVDDFTLP